MPHTFSLKKLLALAMAVFVAAAAPSAAIAQTPSENTYKPDSQILGEVGEVEESAPAPAPEETGSAPEAVQSTPAQSVPAQESAGSLPFTGTDVLLLAVGGAMLLGLGLSLRRFSRTIA